MRELKLGVIGQTGQLARALTAMCPGRSIQPIALGRRELDLSTDDAMINQALSRFEGVDGIVNAAAYTAVDAAESDQDTAQRVNADAVKLIAEYCKHKQIPLVHVSTDYVFNGKSDAPYKPDQKTEPLGVYGRTKLQGELNIKNCAPPHAILRTSWVYDGVGKNFLTTMLRLAGDRDVVRVVNDQFGRPTYANHLAEACLVAIEALVKDPQKYTGTFHVSNAGEVVSWANFAQSIFEEAAAHLDHKMTVTGIPSSEYPSPAARPAYSAMDISAFETVFNHTMPEWTEGLTQAFNEWVTITKGDKCDT